MGWCTSNITIRFRLGHNLFIDSILQDPNISYSLDNFDADLTRDKIESTLGGGGEAGPDQATLETIEQILLDSMEIKPLDVD